MEEEVYVVIASYRRKPYVWGNLLYNLRLDVDLWFSRLFIWPFFDEAGRWKWRPIRNWKQKKLNESVERAFEEESDYAIRKQRATRLIPQQKQSRQSK